MENKIKAWVGSLTDQQLAEARAVTGPVPRWMVDSMQAAGLPIVEFDAPGEDGTPAHGMLMVTAVMQALYEHDR